ncbi:MAG: hypothetical protein R3B97_02220 [Dehalococcoidia bacterium]
MADKIKVMISSRNNDRFDGRLLSEIRLELKDELEAVDVFGRVLFEVWINESAPPHGGIWDSWDVCMQAVRACDVLVAVSNGNAGWAAENSDVGICHAELMTGLAVAPGKVRVVELSNEHLPEGERDRRFQEYLLTQKLFRGGMANTVDELKTRVREAVADALVTLAKSGVRESSKGRFHSGDALDWSRLDFAGRRGAMRNTLLKALLSRSGSSEDRGHTIVEFGGVRVLVAPDAIPAAITVAPAKEMVGQPFLRDHEFIAAIPQGGGGPLHLIACHKGATEAQATRMLGFPDATVVAAPFGVFVADNVQRVQFVFIANCRDETTTRHGVQRFFEWLAQSGEETLVARRAQARARIVTAIAQELENEKG